jgi:transcription initiation factor TFIIA small subunit
MSAPAYYELYRRSTIGVTLTDALDTLISDQKIQPQLAMRILNNFDRIISDNLKLEGNTAKSRLTFKGDLDTYRFCDDVWTFIVKNVLIKMSDVSAVGRDGNGTGTVDSEVTVDKFKIVACNLRKAADM